MTSSQATVPASISRHTERTPWRALVLGDGGAEGEFQRGALPVVATHFGRFDFVTGIGVGALHASILAQYDTLAEGVGVIERLWSEVDKLSDVVSLPFWGSTLAVATALATDSSWARDSVYGSGHLRELIDQHLDWERLEAKRNWAIGVTCLSDGNLYTFTNHPQLLGQRQKGHSLRFSLDRGAGEQWLGGWVKDIVRAAASPAFVLPPVDIRDHRFVGGGLREVMPLLMAVDAFAIALAGDPTLTAEFVVVDNYTADVGFADPRSLDSGREIVARAFRIVHAETVARDIALAWRRLTDLDPAPHTITVLRPSTDHGVGPLAFDNTAGRLGLRGEGADVADEILGDKVVPRHGTPAKIESPSDLPDVLQDFADIVQASMTLRPRSGGYAFSDILVTDGVSMSTLGMDTVGPVDVDVLAEGVNPDDLVQCGAGTTVAALDSYLWARGKRPVNQPGYEKLTFVGVMSVGGHGSGISTGPLADSARAIHAVTIGADGRSQTWWIERASRPVVDKAKFEQKYHGIRLLQEDEAFHAWAVSLGALGVIHSVVLDVVPSGYFREERTLMAWEALAPDLLGMVRDPTVFSVHVWLDPYRVKGKRTCLLSKYTAHDPPAVGHRAWGVTFKGIADLSSVLSVFLDGVPETVPMLLGSSLRACVSPDALVVLPTYEAMNFGTPNLVKVEPAACGVPIDKTLEAVEVLTDVFERRAREANAYVTSPVGMRFVRGSEAFMAMQYGRDTCMIEVPTLLGTNGWTGTLDAFHQVMFERFGGRPHWGQRNALMTPTRAEALYPQYGAFKRQWERFDPTGRFANAFTTQSLGLKK